MTVYEALNVMIAFGILIANILLVAEKLSNKNKK